MEISPKVLLPVLIQIVAAVVLFLVFGDKTFLIGILTGLVTGTAGAIAPPAPGVKQFQVEALRPDRQ